eukprot:CAMPEP_0202442830 /NCGR_PEP_ID=MMETSP1360-20130828/2192_1 /ASSEMBLY_ACC=CAM_ASM_000848 /TAXON_ID=515479 /ORGANISM="Licmophora paradoxa, Strain CCMP2313" /LENGTH=162 /DNA_ID=CAMNT_0049058307 /DNA_START=195 /DNA_END=683 /DNA_ORIENTATION=-
MDIISGRGKICNKRPGNKWFKELIANHLEQYSNTKTKMDKSLIVNKIVDEVRENTPSGGFVRKITKTGQWQVLDDTTAREKVGHAIRDALSATHSATSDNKVNKISSIFERPSSSSRLSFSISDKRQHTSSHRRPSVRILRRSLLASQNSILQMFQEAVSDM